MKPGGHNTYNRAVEQGRAMFCWLVSQIGCWVASGAWQLF